LIEFALNDLRFFQLSHQDLVAYSHNLNILIITCIIYMQPVIVLVIVLIYVVFVVFIKILWFTHIF